MNSVNFKISNSKLRKRYQVCVDLIVDFCNEHFLLEKQLELGNCE